MTRPITAVVFDLDGTLLDTEGLFRAAFMRTAKRFDLKVSGAAYLRLIGVPTCARCAALAETNGGELDLDAFCTAYRAERRALLASGVPVKPDAHATLAALAGMGVGLAAATSASRATALAHLQAAAMLDMLDVVVARDDVPRAKPAPDAFIQAVHLLRRPPAEVIAIEDSLHGLHAAIGAGLRVILIPDLAPLDAAARAMAWRVERGLDRIAALVRASCASEPSRDRAVAEVVDSVTIQ